MPRQRGPEEIIHIQIADFLRLAALRAIWWHTPNGGNRSTREGAAFKKMGVLPGVPDLQFISDGGKASFIEIKAAKGKLTATQEAFRDSVTALGCDYALCRSVEDVQGTLRDWGLLK